MALRNRLVDMVVQQLLPHQITGIQDEVENEEATITVLVLDYYY